MADRDIRQELCEQGFVLVETHISYVFLRGASVYKLKRPVALGFLDFSTLERRKRACDDEVALNRRLAPQVYLGVVALVRDAAGRLDFEAGVQPDSARVVEWAVHMRRLQDEDRADRLLSDGKLQVQDVRHLAAQIAGFHRDARSDARIASFGALAQVESNVEENFAQTEGTALRYLSPEERAGLRRYQEGFLAREQALIARRAREGFVRDGHGDLRLEHCYRTGEQDFVIIDCIEFSERFRYADVCADLAFLAMDLCYHDRVDLAELFVAAYAQQSGDYGVYGLLDFYQSYRAVVRAKVSSILADDAEVLAPTRERARREARRYYLLALAAASRALAPARVLVTFGLMASGKSSLAEALATRLALPLLCADYTRKELLGVEPTEARHDPAFAGAYSEFMTERVYDVLLARMQTILQSGRSVVVDATFRSRAHRERLRMLVQQRRAEVLFLECRCPREVALARLVAREQGPSVSDGRADIYDDVSARFEPADELLESEHRIVDTRLPLAQTLESVLARI